MERQGFFRPTKEYYYPHFKQRLKERYNMDIIYDEYVDLCHQNPFIIYELSHNNRYATVLFNSVKLYTIRYNPNILKTVIIDNEISRPIPRQLRLWGMSKEEFNNRLNNNLMIIHGLKDHLISLNYDYKKFFTTKNTSYPFVFYGLAADFAKGKTKTYTQLIEYMIKMYYKEITFKH